MNEEISQEIFGEIEQSLTGIAAKLGVSDPAGEARSWYARFIDILAGFNSGKLTREIHREDGTVESMPEQPSEEQRVAFRRSIKAYLKTAFKHDLIQAYNKRKRFLQVDDLDRAMQGNSSPVKNHIIVTEEQVIKLSDLIATIDADYKRRKKSTAVARDYLNSLFLLSILKFYKKFIRTYGDQPIVRDLNAKDAREFFIFDIREGRTEAISKILTELVATEGIRSVTLCSRKLLSEENGYFNLNRKISRYFNDALGGMPNRLKRLRLGQPDESGDFDL
jgi:hypothetical protein